MNDIDRSAQVIRIPVDPQSRLRAMTRRLEATIAEQAAAVDVSRATLEHLDEAARSIMAGVASARDDLKRVEIQMERARVSVAELAASVDGLLTAAGIAARGNEEGDAT